MDNIEQNAVLDGLNVIYIIIQLLYTCHVVEGQFHVVMEYSLYDDIRFFQLQRFNSVFLYNCLQLKNNLGKLSNGL